MGKFLLKILVGILLCLGTVVLVGHQLSDKSEYQFSNHETESNLLITPADSAYDYVFLGTSHARNFSRHNNHKRVEKALNERFINLGRGGGKCGIYLQHAYLSWFYAQDNTAKRLVYIISPQSLYAEFPDQASNAFSDEPFSLPFVLNYLQCGGKNQGQQLYDYLHSKTQSAWKKVKPYSADSKEAKLDSVDHKKVAEGMKAAFLDGTKQQVFDENVAKIKATIEMCQDEGTAVSFVITPTLFGQWPGHEELIKFYDSLKDEYGVTYVDFSESMKDPAMFYDHHHLNTNGVVAFTKDYLKPWLANLKR